MKNIKRLFLLATLIIIAVTVFASDLENADTNNQHKTLMVKK